MGRPRDGKGKRPSSQASKTASKTEDADAGTGDDEAVTPAYKRRGRPQRHFKTHSDEEDDDNIKVEANMEDSDGAKPSAPSNNGASVENVGVMGKKRRRRQSKRGSDSTVEDQKDDEPVRQVGFRQHRSRRKSTPRRAAGAGWSPSREVLMNCRTRSLC